MFKPFIFGKKATCKLYFALPQTSCFKGFRRFCTSYTTMFSLLENKIVQTNIFRPYIQQNDNLLKLK